MHFVCELCYENNEPTQYQCKCPEKRCCKSCIDKWVNSGKDHCPYCQTQMVGIPGPQKIIDHDYINITPHIYATSYNVLRITSGSAGLSYSN